MLIAKGREKKASGANEVANDVVKQDVVTINTIFQLLDMYRLQIDWEFCVYQFIKLIAQ